MSDDSEFKPNVKQLDESMCKFFMLLTDSEESSIESRKNLKAIILLDNYLVRYYKELRDGNLNTARVAGLVYESAEEKIRFDSTRGTENAVEAFCRLSDIANSLKTSSAIKDVDMQELIAGLVVIAEHLSYAYPEFKDRLTDVLKTSNLI